jgi:tetratricopeptide (TPR) repeat protein
MVWAVAYFHRYSPQNLIGALSLMTIQQLVKVGCTSLTIALVLGTPIAPSVQASTIAQAKSAAPSAKSGDKSAQAMQAFVAGEKLYDKGDADSLRKAIPLFETAIKLSQAAKDEKILAASLLALMGSHLKLDNETQALEAFEAALPFLQKIEIAEAGKQSLLNEMGGLYLKRSTTLVDKSPDKALLDTQKAAALFRSIQDQNGEATALLMTGRIHLELKKSQAAINSLKQALSIFQSLKDRNTEGVTLLGLAGAHLQLAEIQTGLTYLKQAEQAFRDTKDTDSLKTVQELIQQISSMSGGSESMR